MVGTISGIQQRLGAGINVVWPVLNQLTQSRPQLCSTGFSRDNHLLSAFFKPLANPLNLGTFTGPITTFKGDEESAPRLCTTTH